MTSRRQRREFRLAALILPVAALPLLAGCVVAGPISAASVGAVELTRRSPPDILVSAITGLDCSIVRVATDKPYCKPVEPPPQPPRYCTRSLAAVDCWDRPHPFGYYQRGLADGPAELTQEQEFHRAAPWLLGKIF